MHEWNLIYAYDDAEQTVEVTDTSPPYRKTLSYAQLAASPLRFLCAVKKTNRPAQPDDPLRSLKSVIRYMREGDGTFQQTMYTSYVSGLRAYDAWIRHLREGPRVANGYGHRYMAYAYSGARSFAGPYIRSLVVERFAEGPIGLAASLFGQPAGRLSEVSRLCPLHGESEWNEEAIEASIGLLG
ncbi:hypothetical protein [Paenibacillus sp. GYB003]|uniref:hypothetical protein n=1 Tax=Paenibacillus sp. GYB003 TaxID=2994392 RepID=UPI002F969195